MLIDLHTHSTCSDGTFSPAQLIALAKESTIDIIALTDHDTMSGWDEAANALPSEMVLIRGAEISCQWRPTPGRRPITLHLLAYLFNPTDPELNSVLHAVRESRLHRGERIVAALAADGIAITWPEVLEVTAGAPVGRPHIAQVLIRRGVIPDMETAFTPAWLGERYNHQKANIEVFTALELVHKAGGVAVFAHPKARKRGPIVPDLLIAELAAAGLAGIEVDHPDHTAKQRDQVAKLAHQHRLIPLGSSDFHGTHKTTALGSHATTTFAAYEQLIAKATGCEPILGA